MQQNSPQRNTRQRKAIRDALERAGRPLSPQEILEAARSTAPKLGIATVYRAIRSLVEEGWLGTVELPGAVSRYEVADKKHHHHFHCRRCDSVFDVEDCPGSLKDLAPSGFLAEAHEIILYGLCEGCVTASCPP
ncbi:MAG: transcriptional repressor [Deltaproteobacteria bacterium]|nr:transcriptional repressor [Deltaproteobacteria bacterium]